MLLEREEANRNRPDNHSQTQISWTAVDGYEEVVKMQLEREVKILLARGDVNPDRPDNCENTTRTRRRQPRQAR